jgi:hypothetical protein
MQVSAAAAQRRQRQQQPACVRTRRVAHAVALFVSFRVRPSGQSCMACPEAELAQVAIPSGQAMRPARMMRKVFLEGAAASPHGQKRKRTSWGRGPPVQ